MSDRDIIIKLLAQGSQQVVTEIRRVKEEILALGSAGQSGGTGTVFRDTAEQASELVSQLDTLQTSATQTSQDLQETAASAAQLASATGTAAEGFPRLTAQAEQASQTISQLFARTADQIQVQLAGAISRAGLDRQAASEAGKAAAALRSGLVGRLADLRAELALGIINPDDFKRQATLAIQAFEAELKQQIAQIPTLNVQVPLAVQPPQIPTAELKQATEAFDATFGKTAQESLEAIALTLQQTVQEFKAGTITVEQFTQAMGAIRSDALQVAGDQTQLTAEQLKILNGVLVQTEALGAAGFEAILRSVRESQAALKSGSISAIAYGEALTLAREQAIALANTTGTLSDKQLAKFNSVLNETIINVPRLGRGFNLLRGGMAALIAQSLGLTAGLGSIGQGLLLLSFAIPEAVALLVTIGAAVTAYRFFTTASREARDEHEKLTKQLKAEADQDLPASIRAQKELTAALAEQERALKRLRLLRAFGAEQPGTFAPIENELARRREKELADAVEAGAVAQRHVRDAILETATAYGKALDLGIADNAERTRAVALAGQITERIREQESALKALVLSEKGRKQLEDERIRNQEALNSLDAALRRNPVGDARREAQKRDNANELTQAQELSKILEATNQRAFAQGLEDLEAFHAAKQRIIEKNTAKEVEIAQREAAAALKRPLVGTTQQELEADRVKRAQEAQDLQAKANQKQLEGDEALRANDEVRRVAFKQLAEERLAFEQQILEAEGKTFTAALAQIDAEAKKFREALNQTPGLNTAQRDQQENEFRRILILKAQAEEVQRQVDQAFGELSRARTAITDQVISGQLSEIQGNQKIGQLELDRLPTLRLLAAQLNVIAAQSGNPEALAQVEELNSRLNTMAANATVAADKFAGLREDLARGAGSTLNTFLTDTITQVNSVGAAFEQLGITVLDTLNRIVAGVLSSQLEQTIRKALSPDVLPSAPTEAIQGLDKIPDLSGAASAAAALTAASTASAATLTAGGAASGAALTTGGAAAAAAMVAGATTAAALLAAAGGGGGGDGGDLFKNLFGAVTKGVLSGAIPLATGGDVWGRGTGTSDSILAWLSNGEHVLTSVERQKLLALYGQNWKSYILGQAPRFAQGGTVSAPRAQSVNVKALTELVGGLKLELDQGLIVRTMRANFALMVQEHPKTIQRVAR